MIQIHLTAIAPSVEVLNKVLNQTRQAQFSSDLRGSTLQRYFNAFGNGPEASEQVIIQVIAVGLASALLDLSAVLNLPGLKVSESTRFYVISLNELKARAEVYDAGNDYDHITTPLLGQLTLLLKS